MSELGLTSIPRVIREALAARVLATASKRGLLSYLQPVSGCPGTPRALGVTFEELRLNRVTAAALRASGEAGLLDLAELLQLYEAELAEGQYADHAARVELSIEAVASTQSRFAGIPVVVLDVATRGVAEETLLDALLDLAPAALLGRLGQADTAVASGLDSIQTFLFSERTYPQREPDGSFTLFAASGEAIECVEIARRIHRLARTGCRFDRIGILLRDPERYRPLVTESMRRAGIPAHFTSGARQPDPTGRAFLSLLRCAEEGLSATAFAEYLSLGQVPSDEESAPQPYRWEQLLVDAAVIGGRARWERRLQGVTDELRLQMEQAATDGEIDHYEQQVERYERLAAFALPVIAQLDSLPRSGPWSVWLQALRELGARTLRNPDPVTELLDSLDPLAELGPVDLSDVRLTLEKDLVNRRPPTTDAPHGKVWVGDIEEARGLSFEAVFVPGVNESVFPKPVREDPFLLDHCRERLGMQTATDDTELLRVAVACASQQLILSYSRMDVLNGRQRVPSFFAFETLKAARGSDVDIGNFRDAVEEASGSRLGWPAPDDPAEAIDDAEFDLTVLRPVFDSGGEGEGAYLVAANPHAARSLRARFRRWDPRRWSGDDGLIAGTVHDDAYFEPYRPSKHANSPSALQQFAICPYRYALRSIIGLQKTTTPAPLRRMDPLTRGQIYHAAQARFHRILQGKGMLPVTKPTLPAALDELDGVLASLKEESADRLAPAIRQVWDAEWDSIRADLHGWLLFKAGYETEWTPESFEWSFGLKSAAGRDPGSVAEPVQIAGAYCVTGAVDMMERGPEGVLRVVDHKTGRPPKDPVLSIGGGEKLQPSLYAMAVEQHFQQRVQGGRLFYSTLRGNYAFLDVPLNDSTRNAVEEFYGTFDYFVSKGFLPAAPREGACGTCDFQPVCGPWEEERTKKKPEADLRKLTELREIP